MRKLRTTILLTASLVMLLVLLVFTSVYSIRITSTAAPSAKPTPEAETTVRTDPSPGKQGLVTENGQIRFYNEDGSLFTGGYKEVNNGGSTDYYYFLANGQAFTSGYKAVEIEGIPCYFFFEESGKAFTGGLKEVTFGAEAFLFYFQDTGRALTSEIKTVADTTYYFQSNGRAAKDTFVTLDGRLCYFGQTSALVTGGWFCLEAEQGYYYADSTGKLATDTVIEGYRVDSSGKSTTKYRIRQYADAHTDPSMTDQEKIRSVYHWILGSNMRYIRSYEHVSADWTWEDGWVDDMAVGLMDRWGGNCFHYAAFLGMLIHEATGLPVAVYHGKTPTNFTELTPHGWVTVCQDGIWYIYDVELQKFNDFSKGSCYKVLPDESNMHRQGVGVNLYS